MNLLTDSTMSTNDNTDVPLCNPHTPSSYYVFDRAGGTGPVALVLAGPLFSHNNTN